MLWWQPGVQYLPQGYNTWHARDRTMNLLLHLLSYSYPPQLFHTSITCETASKIHWVAESKHCIPRWENHKKGARGLVGTLKWECQSKGKKEMFLTNGVLKLCQEKSWWYKDLEEIIYHKGKTHCKYFMLSMRWGQEKESKSSLDSGA